MLGGTGRVEDPAFVLDHAGHAVQLVVVLPEILLEVPEALDVLLEALPLRVGDEDHAVHAPQDQLPRHVVVDLARHGVELELGHEAAYGQGGHGQEVEEDGAVVAGGEGDHLALAAVGQRAVDVLQARRLPATPGP
jgi:hypothetical protein